MSKVYHIVSPCKQTPNQALTNLQRLHYWLETIKALAPDAPVLLIATHTDEREPDMNYQLLQDTYPQLVGLLSVSNKTGMGMDHLKNALTHQAAQLPLTGQPWPQWSKSYKAFLRPPP